MKSVLFLLVLFLLTTTQVSSLGIHSYAGTFQIMSQNSHKVLDVENASKQNGAKINQYQVNGGRNQIWDLYYEGDLFDGRTYSLISVNSGKAIDNPSSSKEAGTQMQQYTWNEGSNQMFVMTNVGDGSVYLKNAASGLYLDIKDASKNDGAAVIQSTFTGNNSQKWIFIPSNSHPS